MQFHDIHKNSSDSRNNKKPNKGKQSIIHMSLKYHKTLNYCMLFISNSSWCIKGWTLFNTLAVIPISQILCEIHLKEIWKRHEK